MKAMESLNVLVNNKEVPNLSSVPWRVFEAHNSIEWTEIVVDERPIDFNHAVEHMRQLGEVSSNLSDSDVMIQLGSKLSSRTIRVGSKTYENAQN